MEFSYTSKQTDIADITDRNQPSSGSDKIKPKTKKLVLRFANQQELEATSKEPICAESASHINDTSINAQSDENEVANQIATEIVNQCFFGLLEMEASPNSATSQLESSVPAVVEHQVNENKIVEKDEDENALKSELQPQPQRVMTLPAAIHIMNEFGQKTDVIDIDPNNNQQQLAMSRVGSKSKSKSKSRRYRLTKEEKSAAVLVKNVSFGYSKNHNIISNISLHVPVGK